MTDVAAAGEEAEPLPEAGGQLPERQVRLQKRWTPELRPQGHISMLRGLTAC
jgi:hypothetical protein